MRFVGRSLGFWILEADKAVRVWSIVREFVVPERHAVGRG